MIHTPSTCPPKAQLTLRIGVTRHRANRLAPADQAPISARIRETMERIRNAVLAVLDESDARAAYTPDKPLLQQFPIFLEKFITKINTYLKMFLKNNKKYLILSDT